MGIVLANIIAIYRRELQSYFVSPLAYAIAGVFWFISGLFFVTILFGPDGILPAVAAIDLQGQQGVPVPLIDVPYEFIRAFLDRMGWLLLFILPILSMGLYAEERKRGTLELLATSPLTNWAVAVGKLLGVVTFLITMVAPLLIFEAIAIGASNPPMSPVILLVGHLGLILLAAAILSLGMFVSSLTDSTILAAVMTFALVLLLLFVDLIAKSIGGPVGEAIAHLSLLKHFNTFIQGIFDTSALILFATYIFLGIFLTAQSIDALRFQRQ
ncbi:ABC transporter permease subunit [Nostoc sp. FACHB-87]|uniref:ABC transporter permease n=1 Tax=Nostocaceae TaxID=1162 RepID=UPI0016836A4F|nr:MULTISPECIES: ABC transporter permease [Nostocaceae]MBD2456426.1 ABC transporter permease subunit [Nostoc sp. FACHB-87]MBD2474032.1 ABC transporter permease subunit [Anabaena sp. FACHB-83]